MGFLSWNKKKEEPEATALVPVEQGQGVERAGALVAAQEDNDIVVYKAPTSKGGITLSPRRGELVQVRPKSLKIDGKVFQVDPKELIRMIKQVTQTIGEYKNRDNPYASYVIGALRKARNDMVSDLEHHFKIHWEIDEETGRSIFYV
jgi:hypothetical protein